MASTNPAINEILKKLGRAEDKLVHGARVLTPRQMMMDARDVEERHPDKRVRWVNLRNPDKVAARRLEGYTRMSTEDGGRQLGDETALFWISRKAYDERVESQDELHKQRMEQHKDEMRSAVEAVVRELRDGHGIKVDMKRLLVDEG